MKTCADAMRVARRTHTTLWKHFVRGVRHPPANIQPPSSLHPNTLPASHPKPAPSMRIGAWATPLSSLNCEMGLRCLCFCTAGVTLKCDCSFGCRERGFPLQCNLFVKGAWRNGSASDSRSEGWEFESLCPHFKQNFKFLQMETFFIGGMCITCT